MEENTTDSIPFVIISGEVWAEMNRKFARIENALEQIKKRPQDFWILEKDLAKYFGCTKKNCYGIEKEGAAWVLPL